MIPFHELTNFFTSKIFLILLPIYILATFAISFVFFLPVIIAKFLKKSKKSLWRKIFSGIAFFLSALGIFLSIWFVLVLDMHYPSEAFDRKQWMETVEFPDNTRLAMVDDLRNKKLLDNKTKQEVIELLGEPSFEKDDVYWQMGYYVGEPLLGVDSLWLRFHFNEEGKVEAYDVIGD